MDFEIPNLDVLDCTDSKENTEKFFQVIWNLNGRKIAQLLLDSVQSRYCVLAEPPTSLKR